MRPLVKSSATTPGKWFLAAGPYSQLLTAEIRSVWWGIHGENSELSVRVLREMLRCQMPKSLKVLFTSNLFDFCSEPISISVFRAWFD